MFIKKLNFTGKVFVISILLISEAYSLTPFVPKSENLDVEQVIEFYQKSRLKPWKKDLIIGKLNYFKRTNQRILFYSEEDLNKKVFYNCSFKDWIRIDLDNLNLSINEDREIGKAIEYFGRTLEKKRDSFEAYLGLGLIYLKLGKRKMALENLRKGLENSSKNIEPIWKIKNRGLHKAYDCNEYFFTSSVLLKGFKKELSIIEVIKMKYYRKRIKGF